MNNLYRCVEVYSTKLNKIDKLWEQITNKTRVETNRISLRALSVQDADIIFEGYVNRFEELYKRRILLTKEFNEIFRYQESSFLRTIFNFIFLKKYRELRKKSKEFLEKWMVYEPGID